MGVFIGKNIKSRFIALLHTFTKRSTIYPPTRSPPPPPTPPPPPPPPPPYDHHHHQAHSHNLFQRVKRRVSHAALCRSAGGTQSQEEAQGVGDLSGNARDILVVVVVMVVVVVFVVVVDVMPVLLIITCNHNTTSLPTCDIIVSSASRAVTAWCGKSPAT